MNSGELSVNCEALSWIVITDDVIACEEQKSTHETQSSAVTFCSSHAMASSVIYYSKEAQKNEI